MTIYQVLREDHKKFRALFDQVKETTERAEKTREEILEKLEQTLLPHAKAEEKVLYSRLQKEDETEAVSLEAIEEHRVAERLLKELRALPVTDPHWTAKMEVLRESVEHHLEEEEDEMFEKAREVLSEEEAHTLAEAFIQAKEQQK